MRCSAVSSSTVSSASSKCTLALGVIVRCVSVLLVVWCCYAFFVVWYFWDFSATGFLFAVVVRSS